jgi:hypothetical protein
VTPRLAENFLKIAAGIGASSQWMQLKPSALDDPAVTPRKSCQRQTRPPARIRDWLTPEETALAQRLSAHSPQRQALVRLCQKTNFGSIRGLGIKDGEPVFDPPPVMEIDLKLDGDDPPRPEIDLKDFELSREVARLMDRLDGGNTTEIKLIEVRAGIPRRILFRATFEADVMTINGSSLGGMR